MILAQKIEACTYMVVDAYAMSIIILLDCTLSFLLTYIHTYIHTYILKIDLLLVIKAA